MGKIRLIKHALLWILLTIGMATDTDSRGHVLSSEVTIMQKYRHLISLSLINEVGKKQPITRIIGMAFSDCDEIRYLEMRKVLSDKSSDGPFLVNIYFTTFNIKLGEDERFTVRVRIVLEKFIKQGERTVLETTTLEDNCSFKNASDGKGGKLDGKVDVSIKGTITTPITKRKDYDVNYKQVTDEDQKAFDEVIGLLFQHYTDKGNFI